MIQGYRMAGPPPHGEPPPSTPTEREWPVWLGFAGLAAVVVISIVTSGLIYGIAGVDPGEDAPAGVDLASSLALQLSLIATALVAAHLIRPIHAWQFGLRGTRFLPAVGWAALGMVVFYLLAAVWVALVGEPEQSTAEDVGADEGTLALIGAGVMFVVIAPIAEEIFFRGFFYGSLRTRLPTAWAAIVCGVVFGLIHASTGVSAIPILIVLGIIFCLVRERTGSLYPCIGLHALNNTFAYAGQTDVHPGIAAGLGAAMLVACSVTPLLAWRRPPSPA
jgi:membrane protease YdiL (CAAX protease family)